MKGVPSKKAIDRYIRLEKKLELTKSRSVTERLVRQLGGLEVLDGVTTDDVLRRKKELRSKGK